MTVTQIDPGDRTATAYADAVMASRPFAYWPLDDPPGSTQAREVVSDANGTVVGPVDFGALDPWGTNGAASFDDSFIFELTKNPPLIWTIELWYRAARPGIGGACVFTTDPEQAMVSASFTPAIYLVTSGIVTGFASPHVLGNGTTPTDTGEWHHVAFYFDASTLVIVHDGVRGNSVPGVNPQHWPTAGMQIGVSGNLTRGGYWHGDLAHVAVYDRALSDLEIRSHFEAVEPAPPEPEPEPEPEPPIAPEWLTYIAADGRQVDFVIERGMTGRMMAPVDIWEDVVPLVPGSRFRGARHSARNIVVPIVADGIRYGRHELRQLVSILDPARGMGRLRIVGGPSESREIRCVYTAGLDSMKEDYPHFSRASLLFRVTDPYWTDGNEQEQTFVPGGNTALWFPIFPLALGSSDVFARFTLMNAGDVVSWPSFTVSGPGIDFIAENTTTDQSLWVHGSIPLGRTLRVSTKPGERSVTLDQDNWFSHLDRASTLWGMVPGPNVISIRYSTAASPVTLRWAYNYLAP